MKRVFLKIAAAIFTVGCLSGCVAPTVHKTVDEENIFFILEADIKTLLHKAGPSLAKGDDFHVVIDDVRVGASSQLGPRNASAAPKDSLNYLLISQDEKRDRYFLLNGWMTLKKKDATHVDILYRPYIAQLYISGVAICVDDYDIGEIEWGPN
jgi:hypothetical protein